MHGSMRSYRAGCHCSHCRKANAEQSRRLADGVPLLAADEVVDAPVDVDLENIDPAALCAPYADMAYDEDGRPICHFCGVAFASVGNHAWSAHGVRSAEYRAALGLNRTQSLGSKPLSEHRSNLTSQRMENDPSYAAALVGRLEPFWEQTEHSPMREQGRRERREIAKVVADEYWSDLSRMHRGREFKPGRVCRGCGVEFNGIAYQRQGRRLFITVTKRKFCTETCRRAHCRRGHPWTPDNIYTQPSTGVQTCKTCRRQARNRQRRRR